MRCEHLFCIRCKCVYFVWGGHVPAKLEFNKLCELSRGRLFSRCSHIVFKLLGGNLLGLGSKCLHEL